MYYMCVSLNGESQIILQPDQNALEPKIEKTCSLSPNYPNLIMNSQIYPYSITTKYTEMAYRENHSNIWVWTRTFI